MNAWSRSSAIRYDCSPIIIDNWLRPSLSPFSFPCAAYLFLCMCVHLSVCLDWVGGGGGGYCNVRVSIYVSCQPSIEYIIAFFYSLTNLCVCVCVCVCGMSHNVCFWWAVFLPGQLHQSCVQQLAIIILYNQPVTSHESIQLGHNCFSISINQTQSYAFLN